MKTVFIAIIHNKSATIDLPALNKIAAAIQKQLIRDFYPIWRIKASISVFANVEDVPDYFWKVTIMASGRNIHSVVNNQPYALVTGKNEQEIAFYCSHECLEMLVNPYSPEKHKYIEGHSLKEGISKVKYIVEICDPCDNIDFSVNIYGHPLSDFVTKKYYTDHPDKNGLYSCYGKITKPLDIVEKGELMWKDPLTEGIWLRSKVNNIIDDQLETFGMIKPHINSGIG